MDRLSSFFSRAQGRCTVGFAWLSGSGPVRVAIANCQVPFIRGGAEQLADELRLALVRAGHQAEIISLPFRSLPLFSVVSSMHHWQEQDWSVMDVGLVDLVIPTRFPAFHLQHPNNVVWLTHQHRLVYELW